MTGLGDNQPGHIRMSNADAYRSAATGPPPPPLMQAAASSSSHFYPTSASAIPATVPSSLHPYATNHNNNNVSDSDYYKGTLADNMYPHDMHATSYYPSAGHQMPGYPYYDAYGVAAPASVAAATDPRMAMMGAHMPPTSSLAAHHLPAPTSTMFDHRTANDYYGHAASGSHWKHDAEPSDPSAGWYYGQHPSTAVAATASSAGNSEHMLNMMYMDNR